MTNSSNSESAGRKHLKIFLITVCVVAALWGTLFFLTENGHETPFTYAIF